MKWDNWKKYKQIATGQWRDVNDIKAAIDLIETDYPPLIVEVGVCRKNPNIEGGASYAWASLCYEHNGTYIGVDHDEGSLMFARELTTEWKFKESRLTTDEARLVCRFWQGDAVDFFRQWTPPHEIDLIYIDGWATEGGDGWQEKYLTMWNTIPDAAKPIPLVLYDDVVEHRLWKGEVLIPHLLKNGYEQVFMRNERCLLRWTG